MSVVRLSSRLLAPLNSTVRSSACSRYGKLLASGNRKGFVIVGAAALSTSSSDNNSGTPFLQAQPHQDQFQQLRKFSSLQKNQNQMTALPERRQFSTQEITKNLTLYSSQPRNVEKDPKTLKLKHEIDKPLVVMFSWLLAKQKNLLKYAKLYTDQGYDVLTIEITPWQLLWPTKGAQLVAADVIKFLESNTCFSPLILHGFSVGGYVWGECMVHMARDMDRYQPLIDRIVAQIWDSAADITEIPIGVPKSIFPRNPTLQKALRNYTIYHLKTFHEQATTHYIRSSQMFHSTLVKAPVLFFLSKNDPIGAENSNLSVRETMESLGIKCTWKCWDRSAHVMHYKHHTNEYLEHLFKHLEENHVGWRVEKSRAKLEKKLHKTLGMVFSYAPVVEMKLYVKQNINADDKQYLQLVTADVVKFLESNASYSPLILHGFSIGGYVWGECMVEMAKDMDRYRPIFERIVAQIWDSAADIPEIPVGFPKSVFPRNPILQNALRKYTLYHLKTFHEQATIHYIRSSEIFHYTPVKAPALFLLSKNDPIGSESSNRSVRDAMESLGIKCTWKCWDRSAHVLHYKYHTEEYLDYLFKHLEDNHIGWRAERLRAKL